MMAASPERQTLFKVTALTSQPMPAAMALCRAGFWPHPACTTWPMITACTSAAGTPERSRAPADGRGTSSTALREESWPLRRPKGVRAPATMTASRGEDMMEVSLSGIAVIPRLAFYTSALWRAPQYSSRAVMETLTQTRALGCRVARGPLDMVGRMV